MPSRAEPSRAGRARTLLAPSLIAAALAFVAPPARACPGCAAGVAARAQALGDDFFRNLAIAVLPFVIIGAVCVRAEHVGRWRS
jgi:hypothetical protein